MGTLNKERLPITMTSVIPTKRSAEGSRAGTLCFPFSSTARNVNEFTTGTNFARDFARDFARSFTMFKMTLHTTRYMLNAKL